MIEISVFNLALLIEVMVILFVVCVVVGFLAVRRRSKAKQSALEFAAKARKRLAAHQEHLPLILEKFSISEQDGIPTTVEGFVEPEKELFNGLLNVFVNRDADELFKLADSVSGVSAAYQAYLNVIPQGQAEDTPEAVPEVAPPPVVDDEAIARLTSENAALVAENAHLKEETERYSNETKSTLDTMSHMLTEYSALYGAGDDSRSITMEYLLKACCEIGEDDHGVVSVKESSEASDVTENTEAPSMGAAPEISDVSEEEQPEPVEDTGQDEVAVESADQPDDEIQIEVAAESKEDSAPIESPHTKDEDDDIEIEVAAEDEVLPVEEAQSAQADDDIEIEEVFEEKTEEVSVDDPVSEDDDEIMIETASAIEEGEVATDIEVEAMLSDVDEAKAKEVVVEKVADSQSSTS